MKKFMNEMFGGQQHAIIYFILFALISVCSTQLAFVILDFLKAEKWINMVRPVAQSSLEFPHIAMCNLNRVNATKLPQYNITEAVMQAYVKKLGMEVLASRLQVVLGELSLLDHFITVLFESFTNAYEMTPRVLGFLDHDIANMTLGRALYAEYLENHPAFENHVDILETVATDCSVMYSCTFAGVIFSCCDWSKQLYTKFGSCFTIHPPNTPPFNESRQIIPVTANHATVIGTILNNWYGMGYKLLVDYDLHSNGDNYVPLSAGFHTEIYLEKTVETTTIDNRITLFSKPCTFREKTKYFGMNYTINSCTSECLGMMAYDRCGCVPSEITMGKAIGKYSMCTQENLCQCVIPKVRTAWQLGARDNRFMEAYKFFEQCRMDCITPCNRKYIQMTSSVSSASSRSFVKPFSSLSLKLGYNLTAEAIVNDMIAFDLFFKDLVHRHIETYPRATFEQLFGNLGGVLSLWIGASIFTSIELITWCVDYMKKTNQQEITTTHPIRPRMTLRDFDPRHRLYFRTDRFQVY